MAEGRSTALATATRLTRQRTPASVLAAVPGAVLVVLVIGVATQQPNFLSITSVRGLLESLAPLLLLALGQMFVILTGGIDLSFAVTASFTTVILALLVPDAGAAGVMVALLVATLIGFLNGVVVALFQVPSFIVTLGAMGLYSGLALWISGASSIRIGDGFAVLEWLADLRVAQLPIAGILAVGTACVVAVCMSVFSHGRDLHALGLAEPAVLMSGTSTIKLRMLAFTLCGLFSGFAAVVMSAAQRAGGPTLADSLMLPAIAAVVIGGTAITGGVGGAIRTIIGALIIVVLRVGLTAVGVDPAYEQVVYGAVIIGAVALTLDRTRLSSIK